MMGYVMEYATVYGGLSLAGMGCPDRMLAIFA